MKAKIIKNLISIVSGLVLFLIKITCHPFLDHTTPQQLINDLYLGGMVFKIKEIW